MGCFGAMNCRYCCQVFFREGRKFIGQFTPYIALDLGMAAHAPLRNSFGGSPVGATLVFMQVEILDMDLSYSNILTQSTPREQGNATGLFQVRTLLRF